MYDKRDERTNPDVLVNLCIIDNRCILCTIAV